MNSHRLEPEQWRSPYRFVIAVLSLMLSVSFGLSFFVISPVTPLIMAEYGINRSTVSLLTGLVLLTQAGLAIPGSMLIGRVPLKRLITLAMILSAAPALSFLADDFSLLLALRIVYGIGSAVLWPATGPLLMRWFPPRERPLINGANLAVASLAIALSTFTAAPLAGVVGWKAVLSLFGAVSLAGAGLWVFWGRVPEQIDRAGNRRSLKDALGMLRSRTTLLIAMADAGPFAQYVALTAWLPTFYFEVHGMSLGKGGAAVGLLSLTGVFAMLLAGMVALRVRSRRPFLIVPGIVVGFAGFGTFLLGGTVVLYPALVLLGFCSWFYLPLLLTIPMEMPGVEPEDVSLVWAAIMTLGGGLSFLSPLVVGALTDALGTYIPGFSIFAVLAWSLVISGILLPETGRSRSGRSTQGSAL